MGIETKKSVSIGNAELGTIVPDLYIGQIQQVQPIGEQYRRLGRIGQGTQETGRIGPDSPITMHYLTDSLGDANGKAQTFALFNQQYVQVTEPDGTVWNNVLVKSLNITRRGGAFAIDGDTYAYRVTVEAVLSSQE